MQADIIIVGAGIAGLRCGIELLHKRPGTSIIILEKYKYLGGRVVTYHKTLEDLEGNCTKLQWENGAGRISAQHHRVLELIKEYGLTPLRIGEESYYENNGVIEENGFEESLRVILPQIKQLPSETLEKHTLRDILFMLMGPEKGNQFLLQFPYRGEVNTMRADLAIKSFENEMGSSKGYYVLQEGLSALINAMVEEFKKLGGEIFTKQEVLNVEQHGDTVFVKAKTDAGEVLWKSPKVILALHSSAMKKIPTFAKWNILDKLQMEPLLRTYAVFPTENGKSWFSDIKRTISSGPVRYFIPMNPSCGSTMISYTDGIDAKRFLKYMDEKGEVALGEYILALVRKMFPNKNIPDFLFFKAHPWTDGCTYWLPGNYNPVKLSEESLHPFPQKLPGVYCCGESYSLRQAWMEGALEHADLLLRKHLL